MNNSDTKKRSPGNELFDSGWRQGALFVAPSACFLYNDLPVANAVDPVSQQKRKIKMKEKFVLISQDCDIVASESVEPYVEAILCKPEKPNFVSKIHSKSARWFVINADTGLVAYAMYHTSFKKQILQNLTPEPWPNGSRQLDEFVRWLARRYDRPSIPDALYEVFQRPVDNCIALLAQENPDVFAAFNRVAGDVRVNLPTSEEPPFDLQLILLITTDGLRNEEADAINIFNESIRAGIDLDIVHLHPDIRVLTDEEISLAEFYASRPLYLAEYTYKGEEIEGAMPHKRD